MEPTLQSAVDELRTSKGFVGHIYDDKRGRKGRLSGPGECSVQDGQYKVRAPGGTATIGFGETQRDVLNKDWGRAMTEPEALVLLAARLERDFYRPL